LTAASLITRASAMSRIEAGSVNAAPPSTVWHSTTSTSRSRRVSSGGGSLAWVPLPPLGWSLR
jgi:hypothetical protein